MRFGFVRIVEFMSIHLPSKPSPLFFIASLLVFSGTAIQTFLFGDGSGVQAYIEDSLIAGECMAFERDNHLSARYRRRHADLDRINDIWRVISYQLLVIARRVKHVANRRPAASRWCCLVLICAKLPLYDTCLCAHVRPPPSTHSTGFCVIWVCISSSRTPPPANSFL